MQQNPNVKPDFQKVVTGECRLSYCHLTVPRANQSVPGSVPKYGVTLLIPKSDIATKQRIDAAIEAAKADAAQRVWKGAIPPVIANVVWDGDGVRRDGTPFGPECRGHWVLTASDKNRPRVVDLNRQDIMNESEIYSGMYGRASVRFFGYAQAGNKGIGCALNSVQKTLDGEPLASRSNPDEDYATPMTGAVPAYPPQYGAPAYQPQPAAAPSYQPQYAAPAPVYPAPGYQPAPAPTQPGYPAASAQPQQINPVTGQPMAGPAMGVPGYGNR